jgi:hypothetical protein
MRSSCARRASHSSCLGFCQAYTRKVIHVRSAPRRRRPAPEHYVGLGGRRKLALPAGRPNSERCATLVRLSWYYGTPSPMRVGHKEPANQPLLAARLIPSLPAIQHRQHEWPICRDFKPSDGLEPSTPSLPWRFRGVTRVHARSRATHFLLQIGLLEAVEMRRETSRVSFLMCPFCVRALVSLSTTGSGLGNQAASSSGSQGRHTLSNDLGRVSVALKAPFGHDCREALGPPVTELRASPEGARCQV